MLQIQTVKPDCLALLRELMNLDELKSFRLAGGTALSLHLGHRISIDLDLFTNTIFEVNEFITFLKLHFKERIEINGSNKYGVFAAIDNIKVDLLYRYEKFIEDAIDIENIRLTSLKDIGAMKIHAAADRKSKKDYYDLFELLETYSFAELIDFYSALYPNYGVAGTLKSMSEFDEAELDEDPITLKSHDWKVIREKLSQEIKNYITALKQKVTDAEEQRRLSIEELISKKKNKN